MRILRNILLLAFIFAIIFGCQLKDNKKPESQKGNQELQLLDDGSKLYGEVTKVIFKSKGASTIVFEENKALKTFENIITSAEKITGTPMMVNPELYFDVFYENKNKQRFYLWLGNRGGTSTLMNKNETHTIYRISIDLTNKIHDLIK